MNFQKYNDSKRDRVSLNAFMKKSVNEIPNSVCILRLSSIGDVCHTAAMMRQIQRQWPQTTITWIIGKTEYALVKHLPDVEFITFDKTSGVDSLVKLHQQLRNRHFDILLHLQTALRASLVSLCVKAKRKIGFDLKHAREAQWLFTNEKIPSKPNLHVMESFMGFAQYIGINTCEPEWGLPVDPEALNWVQTKVNSKPFVVISPSASNSERNWSANSYAVLALDLMKMGFAIVLTSGPRESEISFARSIHERTGNKSINLAGQTNLQELLALISQANFVIAPDSGPAHIAVNAGTPVIGLYAHSNPLRTGPYRFREYTVNHYDQNILRQYNKKPADLPWGTRTKGAHLMKGITLDEVKEKVDLLLQNHSLSASSIKPR